MVGKTGPTIDDYPKFENRLVKTKDHIPWAQSSLLNSNHLDDSILKEFDFWETSAFVVIQKGELVYERYWGDYSSESLTNSFSMAKSFTALCIGKAIERGEIEGLDQKVGDFIPEFQEGEKSKINIHDLLSMSSGLDFGESYGDPFGFMAKTYYGTNLYDLTVGKTVKHPAGEVWKYQGGNTLLLSFILEKASGKKLAEYFSEHFWKPLGASQDALWSLNKEEGIERSYCCFYSNAKDYARIGQLVLDSGKWLGRQLISKTFLDSSFRPVMIPSEEGQMIDYYGLHWWLGDHEGVDFKYARGIQGQYILVVPEWNMVIVRLGHKRDPEKGVPIPKDVYTYLRAGKSLIH